MKTTSTTITNGVQTVFPVSFALGYIDKAHVFVYTGNVYTEQTGYTWVNETTIETTSVLPSGTTLNIRRVVPKTALINDYTNNAILEEQNLDQSFKQAMMWLEEIEDGFVTNDDAWIIRTTLQMTKDLDMAGNRILNLPTPSAPTDPVRLQDIDAYFAETVGADLTLRSDLANPNSEVVIAGLLAKSLKRRYDGHVNVTDYTSLSIYADITAAIQAALDNGAGGSVEFPKGTFTVVRSLNVKSNTEVFGHGAGTLIQGAADGLDIFTTGTGLFKTNIEIRNLVIDGGGQTTDVYTGFKLCRGIYATNISNLCINDVTIRKMGVVNQIAPQIDVAHGGYGIFITSRFGLATNIRINDCTVIDIAGGGTQYGDGINVDAHESFVGASYMDVVISGCYVTRVGRHCYTVGGGAGESIAAGIKFVNCYGEKAACDWLDVEEGIDVLVSGCTISSCGNDQYYYNPVAEYGATYRLLAGIATGNDSRGITIKDTKIRGCYYGITYGATNGLTLDNVEIEGSTVADIQQGLSNGATGFKVSKCKFKTPNKPVFNHYSPSSSGEVEIENTDFYSQFISYAIKGAQFDNNTFRAGFKFAGSGSDNSDNTLHRCKFKDYAGAAIITTNNQQLGSNTIDDCDFFGARNMTAGVDIAFNATRKWQIKNNRFYNLPFGVRTQFGNGTHLCDVDGNEFHNCGDAISMQQSIRDASISRNKFFGTTGWCIRVYDIDGGTPMPHGLKIRDNMAYEGCVNGVQVSLASGGSYNYTMLTGNDMHNCSGTKWSLAAGNANGIVANNITV